MKPVRRLLPGLVVALAAGCGARSGLSETPTEPETLSCHDGVWRARPNDPTRIYAGVPPSERSTARWSLVDRVAGAQVTLDGQGDSSVFRADREGQYTVEVVIGRGAADGGGGGRCVSRVEVRAEGPTVTCPAEILTAPLRAVEVRATAQADRGIDSVRWTVADAPGASSRPAPVPEDNATTRFTPDVAGDFLLRFEARDESGASSQCVTRVRAIPGEGLRIELSWDPPGRTCPTRPGAACDGSDVDLHLVREAIPGAWGGTDDCHWANCNASARRALAWGSGGAADDPRLDLDDVTGHGPENVNIDLPSGRVYRVGVHYFSANGGDTQQVATVQIYCGSPTPVARFGPVVLRSRGGSTSNDLWLVGDVLPLRGAVPSCRVVPIERAGGPWILPYADAQRGQGPSPP